MIIDKLFIGSKYVFAGFFFLINLWIVRTFQTADFGELSFFRLSLQYLQFAELGLLQYVFRSLSAEEKIANSDINKIISYLLISVITVFSLYAIVGNEFSFFTDDRYVFILIFCIINGLFGKHTIDRLRIDQKTTIIVLLEGISIFLLFVGVGLTITIFERRLIGILITLAVYQIPYLLYFFIFLYRGEFFRFDFRFNKELFYGSIMLASFAVISLFFFSIDRLIIKFNWGFVDLGLYAFPLTVVNGGFIVMQSILWLNMPNFISSIKNSTDYKNTKLSFKIHTRKLLKIYFVMFLIASFGYAILIKYFTTKYENTFLTFVLLFIFYLFNLLYVFEQNYLIAHKKYKILVLVNLFVGVLNFCINYILSKYNNVELLIAVSICCHILLWKLLTYKVNRCSL